MKLPKNYNKQKKNLIKNKTETQPSPLHTHTNKNNNQTVVSSTSLV